jgi:hypothetical protein
VTGSTLTPPRSIPNNHSNPSSEKAEVSHDSLTPAISQSPLDTKIQADFSGLDGTGRDRRFHWCQGGSPTPPDSTPAIEFQSLVELLSSLEVGGATILGVALWYWDFSGSSIDGGD